MERKSLNTLVGLNINTLVLSNVCELFLYNVSSSMLMVYIGFSIYKHVLVFIDLFYYFTNVNFLFISR